MAVAVNVNSECGDSPIRNISAEDPDVDKWLGVIPEWPDQPITGDPFNIYFSWGCLGICYSIISQEDADLCASNQAIECVADAPGGTTPANPGNPRGLFASTEQTCAIPCSGGGTFSFTLAAGGVLSPYSQADANARAAALACKLGKMFKMCIVVVGATDVCKDDFASFVVRATGPLTQFPLSSEWSITGPGIAVNLFSYDTSEAAVFGTTQMRIFGTPTVAGDTYIIARITDNNSGFFMERQIPISVNQCDVDWGNITPSITSAAITYWDSGNDIPAGIYRVAYFNGAWISPGPIYLVGDGVPAAGKGRGYYIKFDDGAQEVAFPPSGLYSSQAECEAANAGASITFAHTGGKIGMYLHDSPYNDNTDGSPNPTFKLETI